MKTLELKKREDGEKEKSEQEEGEK